MDILGGFIIIAFVYLWFLFIDRFLKSCSHYAYIQFLNGTGLEIGILQFKWTTTAFNRILVKWGAIKPKLQTIWFNIGLYTSLLLLPISIYLILMAFIQNFQSESTSDNLIEPIVPGLNLPASEIGYYSLSLLICSIVHELGHALAAVQEDVTLLNVGAKVLFILPITFVDMNSDKLFSLNLWKRLKIFCAGIWHNLFIALIAYLLYNSTNFIFSPFYRTGDGIVVIGVVEKTTLTLGSRALNQGIIVDINNCRVDDEETWYNCLSALKSNKTAFCLQTDLVHNLDESVHLKHLDNGLISCCNDENYNNGRLCFEYLDNEDSILEFPPYVCLPGRSVIEQSIDYCMSTPYKCPKDTYCFRPVLLNHTNLYKIKRLNQPDVIYIGPVSDLYRAIQISPYIPKFRYLSTTIPDCVTKLLKYIVVFSIGFAIVNILPCLFMDGQHIFNTICLILFAKHLRTTHIQVVSAIISVFFTLILIVHCLIIGYRKLIL